MPTDPYADIIDAFSIYYRFLTCQSYDEANTSPATNTDADILYNSFGLYADLAADELVNLLAARNIPTNSITINQEIALLCHLVADYFERGNPDWSFRSQSQAPGVSFSRGEDTGPRLALTKMLDELQVAAKMILVTGRRGTNFEIIRIKDAKHYPNRWKRTCIPSYDPTSNGFDESEVFDQGVDYNQGSSNEW
jgi:hypothetical protein